jgi:hypothetical protein
MSLTMDTDLCNMALSMIGVGQRIADVETERSEEAIACREFYIDVMKLMFEQFPYPFAEKSVALGLVEEEPNDEWGYSYGYPSDCVDFKRIVSGLRNDTPRTRIKYKIVNRAGGGKLIYTDQPDAVAEYTGAVDDTSNWSGTLRLAFAALLATFLPPRIGGLDGIKAAQTAQGRFNDLISQAKTNAANEEKLDPEGDTESIRARE